MYKKNTELHKKICIKENDEYLVIYIYYRIIKIRNITVFNYIIPTRFLMNGI